MNYLNNKLFIRDGYTPDPDVTIQEVVEAWPDVLSIMESTDKLTAEVASRTSPDKVVDGVLFINAGTLMKKRIMENHAALEISLMMKALLGKNVGVCVI